MNNWERHTSSGSTSSSSAKGTGGGSGLNMLEGHPFKLSALHLFLDNPRDFTPLRALARLPELRELSLQVQKPET